MLVLEEWIRKDQEQRSKRGFSVNDVITHANEQDYDEIIVIGIKNNHTDFNLSVDSGLKAVGILEQVKHAMLNQ